MTNLKQELQQKYDAICDRIKELENLTNKTYKTSCQFRYNPSNSYSGVHISSCLSIKDLIDINAFIQTKHEHYLRSAQQLELNEFPEFLWLGYSPELWMHDVKLRISVLSMDKELTKLKELKAKIQPYLPEDNKIKQLLLELGQ